MPLFGAAKPTLLTRRWIPLPRQAAKAKKADIKKEMKKENEVKANEKIEEKTIEKKDKKDEYKNEREKKDKKEEEGEKAEEVNQKNDKKKEKKDEKNEEKREREKEEKEDEKKEKAIEKATISNGLAMSTAPQKPDSSGCATKLAVQMTLPFIGEKIHSKHDGYLVIEFLGKGSFGAVFKVRSMSDGQEKAMKCEMTTARKPILKMETKILERCGLSPHVPTMHSKGTLCGRFSFIIMELVGPSLWDIRVSMESRRFSFSTTMQVGSQILAGLHALHAVGFLHRDVKPSNVCAGLKHSPKQQHIFLIDFGLCRKFRKPNGEIRLKRETAPFRGTIRYASISALLHNEQSRKDDLESWIYLLIELHQGDLPWAATRDVNVVLEGKLDALHGECSPTWMGMPLAMFKLYRYVCGLRYASVPDYAWIDHMLHSAAAAGRVTWTEPLDWIANVPFAGPLFEPVELPSGGRTGLTKGSTDSASTREKNKEQ